MNTVDVCFSPDSKYTIPCLVAIQSLCMHTCANCNVRIHILGGNLTTTNKTILQSVVSYFKNANIRFIDVDESGFQEFYTDVWGTSAAFRIRLGELLPDLDRVLYLDCDVIVRKSIEELFFIDIGQNVLGMVPDIWHKKQSKRFPEKNQAYFNTGVCLVDLKKWRERGVSSLLIDFYHNNKGRCYFPDQDVINAVMDGCIFQLGYNFNFCWHWDKNEYFESFGAVDVNDAVIIHYVFNKPWWSSCIHPYAYLYDEVIEAIPNAIKERGEVANLMVKKQINRSDWYLFGVRVLKICDYYRIKDYDLFGFLPLLRLKQSGNEVKFYLFRHLLVAKKRFKKSPNVEEKTIIKNDTRYSCDYLI